MFGILLTEGNSRWASNPCSCRGFCQEGFPSGGYPVIKLNDHLRTRGTYVIPDGVGPQVAVRMPAGA